MGKQSAGILMFRERGDSLEVLLVHPGGPFWAKKDDGAWSVPKGEFDDAEDAESAARREFLEETGHPVAGELVALAPVKIKSGKTIHAWAVRGEFDPSALRSDTFEVEWPPRSGRRQSFPEVDRAEWFPIARAAQKISDGQRPLLHELWTLRRGDLPFPASALDLQG